MNGLPKAWRIVLALVSLNLLFAVLAIVGWQLKYFELEINVRFFYIPTTHELVFVLFGEDNRNRSIFLYYYFRKLLLNTVAIEMMFVIILVSFKFRHSCKINVF